MKKGKWKHGEYTVENPNKYIGTKNPKYRSSWEEKFLYWCDHSPKIYKWGYECLDITYYSPIDNKVHRYFPDFYLEIYDVKNNLNKYIVEVKPYKQTIPPKIPKRKTKNYLISVQTYITNQCKWEAANKFCASKNIKFKIITENEIFNYTK